MLDTPSNVGHMLTQRVKLLQKVALWHEGKVLLIKRADSAYSRPGAWDLPGGNSEWPSSDTQSQFGLHILDAVREVREETGLEIDPGLFNTAALTYTNTFFDAPKQIYSVILGWRIELPANIDPRSVKLSQEHSQFAWATANEVATYDFGGEKGEFVREIVLGKGQASIFAKLL